MGWDNHCGVDDGNAEESSMNPLETLVTSLELSKRLKELGYKQDTVFYWKAQIGKSHYFLGTPGLNDALYHTVSAPTAGELGLILPDGCRTLRLDGYWMVFRDSYQTNPFRNTEATTEADARALCLIHLAEKGLVRL